MTGAAGLFDLQLAAHSTIRTSEFNVINSHLNANMVVGGYLLLFNLAANVGRFDDEVKLIFINDENLT